MFEKIKERNKQIRAEREMMLQEKKQQLLSLSEKELLIEILLELNRMNDELKDVKNTIILYSHN